MITENQDINLENLEKTLFESTVSGSGEEEMLKVASRYALQLSTPQLKLLLFLDITAGLMKDEKKKKLLQNFIKKYLEMKQHNNSAVFVMRALDSISLKKYINENSFKINVAKGS